jgi:hypothetical protein
MLKEVGNYWMWAQVKDQGEAKQEEDKHLVELAKPKAAPAMGKGGGGFGGAFGGPKKKKNFGTVFG